MLHLTLRKAIEEVQRVGKRHGFSIAIVGGSIVRLISNTTKIQKIVSKDKVIYLSMSENPLTQRIEDHRTTIDIDAIAFSLEQNPFLPTVSTMFEKLQQELKTLSMSQKDFPAVSIEPVFYHPSWPEPNTLTQFVSSIELYKQNPNHFIFRLGTVTQEINLKSLDIWTLKFVENPKEELLTLMPPALQRRYAIRGFSRKPKDVEKIWGKSSPFAQFVKAFNKQTNNQFEQYFTGWDAFEKKIHTDNNALMQTKRGLWNAYWSTIGTYLAHGTGFIGRILLPFGNTIFAGK